jgi:hypothetical protein
MARTPKGTPPSYPKKPHKGQARITVRLPNGKRRDLFLGAFGSAESRAEYRRVLAELEVSGGHYPLEDDSSAPSGLTVSELCMKFWKHAETYYRLPDGSPTGEQNHYEYALNPVLNLASMNNSGVASTITGSPGMRIFLFFVGQHGAVAVML